MVRIIAHLDMDAFFAAVEEHDNPRWRGMPLVVGADPKGGRGRGVVSTANYVARRYGIRSALPISTAWRFAQDARKRGEPETIFLPVNGRRYGEISHRIMERAADIAREMEPAGIDEAYLDLSHFRSFTRAQQACRRLKRAITRSEGLTCSIGLAANKLVAKVASDFQKPDGLTVVLPRSAMGFLAPLHIRTIPGIGPKTERLLKQRGLVTVADVQALSEGDAWQLCGEWGLELYDIVRGNASDRLHTTWTPKSAGRHETMEEDTLDSGILVAALTDMAGDVLAQLKKDGFTMFGRVVLTVRFADFSTVTRSHTLERSIVANRGMKPLVQEMLKLFLPFLDKRENPAKKLIRLVGVRTERLA